MTSRSLDSTLSEAKCGQLTTRSGLVLNLRQVEADDAPAVQALFDSLSPDDMRFRFLSAQNRLSTDQLIGMVAVDHRHAEHLLAFDQATKQLVASLMLVADAHMESAEVAIAVLPAYKGHGIGWTLLQHASDLTRQRGLHTLRSIESRENHQAIEVERALGFSASDYDGDTILLEAKFD